MKFRGYINKVIYRKGSYAVYAVELTQENKKVQRKNGKVLIAGNYPKYRPGITFNFDCKEVRSEKSVYYEIEKIHVARELSKEESSVALRWALFSVCKHDDEFSQIDFKEVAEQIIQKSDFINLAYEGKKIEFRKLKILNTPTLRKAYEYLQSYAKDFKIIANFIDTVPQFNDARKDITLKDWQSLQFKFNSFDELREEFVKDPYFLLCVKGNKISFKRADDFIRKLIPHIPELKDVLSSAKRCRALGITLLKDNEQQGHTMMLTELLRDRMLQFGIECSGHIDEVLKTKSFHIHSSKKFISLYWTYQKELKVAELKTILFKKNSWNYDVEDYREINGVRLSDEQISTLEKLCKLTFSILNGPAGSGKTFTVDAVVKMLKDKKHSFKLIAPTGQAANVMEEYTGETAYTVHRALGWKNFKGSQSFVHNANNKLKVDVIIIDEFSMVDLKLFCSLFDAIDFEKTKLLIVGDQSQLPSIGCGKLLYDLLNCGLHWSTSLTNIFRYADGGLYYVATKIRKGERFLPIGNKEDIDFGIDYKFKHSSDSNAFSRFIQEYKALLDKGVTPDKIKVLAAMKPGRLGVNALNEAIQEIANPNIHTKPLKVGSSLYYKGDIIMQMKNKYIEETDGTRLIANGQLGTIVEITKKSAVIMFGKQKEVYSIKEMRDCCLGYATTIHKSQGSSAPHIIVLTPRGHEFMLNSPIMYVGTTRTKTECTHIGDSDTVNRAVSVMPSDTRNTFLPFILSGEE